MKKYNKIILSLLSIGLLFSSCKKDDSKTENNQSVIDVLQLLSETQDIISLSEDALMDFDSRMRVSGNQENNCKSVLLSPADKTITIDFGNVSCIVSDGRSRQGKIKISYQGSYRTPGFKTEIKLDNYIANGKKYWGSLEVLTTDETHYAINVKDMYYKSSAIDSTIWNATLNKVWKSGMSTTSVWDDQYELTGTSSGIDQLFQKYNMNINSNLLIDYNCFTTGSTYPTKGTMDVATTGFLNRNVDFGIGDCDKSITLTTNGVSTIIRL